MSNQLATTGEQPSILAMMAKLTDSGATTESVAMMTQLVLLHERLDAKAAEKAWARDFALMQSEMPSVSANKVVSNSADKGGGTRYKYAPLDEIMATIQPTLTKFGFAVSFDMRVEEARMVAICSIFHKEGHVRTTQFPVRVGRGAPGCNESQADGSARSYAKRYALCDALNIPIDHDDDAGALSPKTISFEDATKLRERLLAAGGDEAAFLLHIKEESFGSIPATKLEFAEGCVRKKERASK